MRILQLGKYFRKDGGIETHVKSLCKGLAENGVDVVNLVSSTNNEGSNFLVDGYRVVEAPTLGIIFSTSISPSMISLAYKLHREKPFDLIHLNFPDPMSHLASLILPKDVPRVITWHSDIIKQKKLLKFYRPMQKSIVINSAALITPTEAHFTSSQQIPHNFSPNRRSVIPYGMNFERFNISPKILKQSKAIRENIGKDRFIVFALGRHVEYKGFSVLIDAVKKLDVHLILGGEGPLTTDLQKQTQRLEISDRVTFTGRLTEIEIATHYHSCDIFCLPSITQNEAFGLVQLEAMACGKPVICTQLNNGVNVLNPHLYTGLTVTPNSPEELSHAIVKLKEDIDLRTTLGMNALKHARETYSLESMTNAHINLYSQLTR